MIIKIFKSNERLVNLLAIFLLCMIWVLNYFLDNNSDSDYSLGYEWLDLLISLGLISFQIVFLNSIINKHKLFNDNSHLTGLFIVVLNSLSLFSLTFNQIIVANTFLILALAQVFRLYNANKKFGLLFNSGVLIGFATIFYLPSIVYFLFLWIVLIYLTTPVWRDFAISLIGFVLPLIYYIAYFFVFEDLPELVFISENQSIYDFSWYKLSFWSKFMVVTVLGICSISCMRLLLSANKSVARIRKMLIVVLLYFLTVFSTLFLNQFDLIATLLMMTPPMAIIIANYFHQMKKLWFAELIFGVVVFASVMSYFS